MGDMRHVDVLIVGAGPTGSTLALLLARYGIRTLVADREATIYALPRAAHIDHETLRIFQAIGLADEIAATCRQATRYDFVNKDGEVLLRFDGADMIGPGGWPASNMIHQPSIERALRDAIVAEPSIELHTGWSLSSLSPDEAGVTATFGTAGDDVLVTAKFVVGADGARSPVRTLSGIGVDDLDFDEPWLVVDTIVHDPERLPKINLQICDPERPTTCVLMGAGRHRWEFMLRPGEMPEQVVEDAFVAGLMRPWDVEGAVSIERTAVYRFAARIAVDWQRERVLIAGDAAHQMPPFAGQGMCSGIRDAHNLAWKLAAAVGDDTAAMRLLASYQVEREPNVRAIVGLAMMMGRTVCMLDPVAAAARDLQMLAARAAGPLPPRPPSTPPLAAGWLLAGSTAAGEYFPQLSAETCVGGRLDDALGPTAWLIAREGPLPPDDTFRGITLDDPVLAPFRTGLTTWLDERKAIAVLVRADRYVFATGDPAALAHAFSAWGSPPEPPSPRNPLRPRGAPDPARTGS